MNCIRCSTSMVEKGEIGVSLLDVRKIMYCPRCGRRDLEVKSEGSSNHA